MSRFEEYLRSWMKKIQELLLESEQLRLETDDAGPQVENGVPDTLHNLPIPTPGSNTGSHKNRKLGTTSDSSQTFF